MTFGYKMPTLKEQLDRFRGHGPGFDAARLFLSMTILCWHSVVTSYGHQAEVAIWQGPFGPLLSSLMPMFFALSGFLVMGSFERTRNLKSFLMLRALRIVPALLTEILISALILGSIFTILPLHDYFTNWLFFKYFFSIIGKVSFILPGVFLTNPDPERVNISLWTIAPELTCYVYLGLQLALRFSRRGVTWSVATLLILNVVIDVFAPAALDPTNGVILSRQLILCFGLGNLFYVWRHKIPFNQIIFFVSIVLSMVFFKIPILTYFSLACLSYIIIYFGCTKIPVPAPFSSGDYSYGIYLYAYPIQQTFIHLFPAYRQFYYSIIFSLPLTCLVAAASWWFIEAPVLKNRNKIIKKVTFNQKDNYISFVIPVVLLALYGCFLIVSSSMTEPFKIRLREAFPVIAAAAFCMASLRWMFLRSTRVSEPVPAPHASQRVQPE